MKANLIFTIFPNNNCTFDSLVEALPKSWKIHKKGTPKSKSLILYKENSIYCETNEIQVTYIDKEIDKLINRVWKCKSILQKHPKHTSQLEIVCYTNGQTNPEIVIGLKTICKLGELRTKIWTDIYCTPGEDNE